MKAKLILVCLMAVLLICGASPARAQVRIAGAVSGSVTDATGAVVPNAKAVLKDELTGITRETVTNALGAFLFPNLSFGQYEITVSVEGFDKAVLPHVRVDASRTTDVPVTLKVGVQTQTVTVEGMAPVLETTSQLVAMTQTTKLVNELPLAGRQALDLARLVPGFVSQRINNLAGGAMNVTLDGINDASNGYKSGGTVWYTTVPIRLGALEEVTVESGGLGADAGAQSGVNVKFITRRGSNQYHGSLLYQPNSEQFNANTWSRNANSTTGWRVISRNHTFGGNFGGRLVPFGYLKDKLFVFANWEDQWNPSRGSVTTSVMTAAAQQGVYTYVLNANPSQTASVNVLQIAAAQGARATIDPVAKSILDLNNQIPKYAVQVPTSDLNTTSWAWTRDTSSNYYYPSTRVDYYVTSKHQVSFIWNYRHEWTPGTARFPDPDSRLTAPFRVGYFVWSASLQSTLSPTTINEIRYGTQHSGDSNASATDKYGTYNTYNGKPLRIGGSLPFGPLTPYIDQNNTTGRHFITTIYDTLTKQFGKHAITAGVTYRRTDWKDTAESFALPTYGLGTPSGDSLPNTLFTATTVPGINPNSLPAGPAGLYNTLVGRVASASYRVYVDPATRQYGGFINYTWTRSYMGGAYIQDRWRVTPSLTLNYGLRWETQGNMYDVMGITAIPDLKSVYGPSVGLFRPGVMSGNNDPTASIDNQAYKPDYLNFAPNFGIAWNPRKEGFLGRFLDGKTVIRASYGVTYYDEGTQMFAQNMGTNTGKTASQTLQAGTSSALPQFTTLSDIVANPATLSAFTGLPVYSPVLHQSTQTFSGSFAGIYPTLVAPYVINWTFGIQRELLRNTVLEVKYVGNQSHRQWRTYNLNEVDSLSNGFLQEFKNAKNNLDINRAAGVTSFANRGLPSQVALPIFDAAFGPRGTVTAISSGSGYTSSTFINNLDNGAAGSLAGSLTGQNYACRMFGNSFSPCLRAGIAPTGQSYDAAGSGYPINFFLLNPYSTSTLIVDNSGWHSYNALQASLRHGFSHGLTWTINYTFSKSLSNTAANDAVMRADWTTQRNLSMDRRPSIFDQRHGLQAFGTYDLPVGKGHLLNLTTSNDWINRLFDRILSGWTASSVLIFGTGTPVQLGGNWATVNGNTSGVMLAPGVTLQQISDMFRGVQLQKVNQTWTGDPRLNRAGATDTTRIGVPLELIGSDGRANPKYLTWNSTPGQWGQILYFPGKNSFTWNAAMTKTFRVTERMSFELYGAANNVLNHSSWGMPSTSLYSTSFGTVGAPSGNRTMTFRGTLRF